MGLQYFTLKTQRENPIPEICSWYGKLDERKLTRRDYKQLPNFFLLDMKTGTDILYPDVITEPFLLVSKGVMDVLKMYDTDMPFLFAVLYDISHGESISYYLPVLKEGDEECREPVYRIKIKTHWEIRIRLDVVESLLYRGVEGMELVKIG